MHGAPELIRTPILPPTPLSDACAKAASSFPDEDGIRRSIQFLRLRVFPRFSSPIRKKHQSRAEADSYNREI